MSSLDSYIRLEYFTSVLEKEKSSLGNLIFFPLTPEENHLNSTVINLDLKNICNMMSSSVNMATGKKKKDIACYTRS